MRCLHCTMIFLIRNSHFDLTYLRDCEPSNLVKVKGTKNVYCTAEHDSLKISNGKGYWWSRGFGGVSALDYLMKVRGFGFVESIEILTGRSCVCAAYRGLRRNFRLDASGSDERYSFRLLADNGLKSEDIFS